jgi:hypothetical protein
VEALEKKGILTGKDIDKTVRRRLEQKKDLTKFEDKMSSQNHKCLSSHRSCFGK